MLMTDENPHTAPREEATAIVLDQFKRTFVQTLAVMELRVESGL
jgi:hypothetical protein